MSGTAAVLTSALTGTVTDVSGDKIEGTVTITAGGNPDSAAQLKTINDATNATIIIPSKAVALSGTAAVLVSALDGTVTDAAGDKIEG